MADSNDVELLRSGAKDVQRCDFSGHSFAGQTFEHVDFRGCNLTKSNFSGCVLRGCDLRGADLAHSNFSGATLLNCHVDRVAYGVNFDRAIIQGGTFKPLTTLSTFRGTKWIAVNVKGIRFGDSNVLEGAIIDEVTDFNGTPMPRALSRMPIFSAYTFDRGQLKRIGAKPETIVIDLSLAEAVASERGEAVGVRLALASNRDGALLMCLSLSNAITDFISKTSIPNEPDKLEFHQNYISLLSEIRGHVDTVSDALRIETGSTDTAQLEVATASVLSLKGVLQSWWQMNGAKAVDYGANVGLLGVGTALLTFCGAPAVMATGICAVLSGSKAVIDYVKMRQEAE